MCLEIKVRAGCCATVPPDVHRELGELAKITPNVLLACTVCRNLCSQGYLLLVQGTETYFVTEIVRSFPFLKLVLQHA